VAIESSGRDETYAWDKVAGAERFGRVGLFEAADAHTLPAAEVVRRIYPVLDKIRPRVVLVPGWSDSAALAALKWCQQNRVPSVIMSDSTAWDAPRSGWRETIKRQVVGLASAALVAGSPHKDYVVELGMAADRVFLGYDVVDNDYFSTGVEKIGTDAQKIRRENSLPEHYFLASNRFVEKKNLPRLLQAFAQYRTACAAAQPATIPWELILMGDGPLRPELVRLIADLALQDSVLLPGFRQYPELPAYYGLAGAFIHASTVDQWGLVVNEAMACGLPVLISHRCGCAQDLVKEGVNGFTFDPLNTDQLAQLMLEISGLNFPLAEFGEASRQVIANWGPERFAQGLQDSVECALQVGPVKANLLQRAVLTGLLRR
jgi:1,2-diacylglycerol 3-alpha-glucosyltransferase